MTMVRRRSRIYVSSIQATVTKTANLLFTYTPIETIIDGELKFTVPSGWDDPQRDSASAVQALLMSDTTGGRIGSHAGFGKW